MGERRPPSLTLSCVRLALVGFINQIKERYPAVQSKKVCFLDADSCRSEYLLKGGDLPSASCLTPAPEPTSQPGSEVLRFQDPTTGPCPCRTSRGMKSPFLKRKTGFRTP